MHELCLQASNLLAELSELVVEIGRNQLAVSPERAVMALSPNETAAPMKPFSNLLSANDVAAILSVDAHTIRRWRTEGKLPPAIVVGGVVRWRSDAIERWVETQTEASR